MRRRRVSYTKPLVRVLYLTPPLVCVCQCCCRSLHSFGLPHLSRPPNLATFAPSPVAPPTDVASENATPAASSDVMSDILSQMVLQLATGKVVSH